MRRLLKVDVSDVAVFCACLCALSLVFWPFSYWYFDAINLTSCVPAGDGKHHYRGIGISSYRGVFVFHYGNDVIVQERPMMPPLQLEPTHRALRNGHDAFMDRDLASYVFGFGGKYRSFHFTGTPWNAEGWHTWMDLGVPHWFPALLCAVVSPFAFRRYVRRRRERRRAAGLCLTCSYDLRAHTPGQKCPECGTAIAARAPDAAAARG